MAGLHAWMILGVCLVAVAPSFQQIPLAMYEKLGNITNARELMDKMLIKRNDTEHEDLLFAQQGAIDPVVADIVAGSVAQADMCSPKIASVDIPKDDDPNVCFYPNCVAMPQCGGCGCGHDMLECAPVEERITEVEVMKMRYPYPGASKFTFEGLVTIGVEEHIQCACRCKVQPHHCHPTRHLYEEHSCRCKCRNDDDIRCPPHKMWSNHECGCVCPKRHWCLQDEFFSNTTCRCEMRSSFIKIVDQKQVPIQPMEDTSRGPCRGVRCKPGYRALRIGDLCHCRISHVSGVRSGSIGGGGDMVVQPEAHLPQQPQDSLSDFERVPGHPQFHHVPTTSVPVRRTRQRRPRRGPGTPIRQTGSMVPRG